MKSQKKEIGQLKAQTNSFKAKVEKLKAELQAEQQKPVRQNKYA